jgi:cytochrome c biogenesis protein CcmG/thiol:disulfide interchange protein DsbE
MMRPRMESTLSRICNDEEAHVDSANLKQLAVKAAVVLVVAAAIAYIFGARNNPGENVPVSERKAVSQFALPDLAGHEWKLTDYRGRVVLLNFWATWCQPCREETPALVNLSNRFRGNGLEVAGVVMDDDKNAPVQEFMKEYGVLYPVLVPPSNSSLLSAISALPTTLLFDRHGRVVRRYQGAVSESQFRTDIEAVLSEP